MCDLCPFSSNKNKNKHRKSVYALKIKKKVKDGGSVARGDDPFRLKGLFIIFLVIHTLNIHIFNISIHYNFNNNKIENINP